MAGKDGFIYEPYSYYAQSAYESSGVGPDRCSALADGRTYIILPYNQDSNVNNLCHYHLDFPRSFDVAENVLPIPRIQQPHL